MRNHQQSTQSKKKGKTTQRQAERMKLRFCHPKEKINI